jgi:hypothetical protein
MINQKDMLEIKRTVGSYEKAIETALELYCFANYDCYIEELDSLTKEECLETFKAFLADFS